MKKHNFLLLILLLVSVFSFGQTYNMGNGANGTISTCTGTFRDGAGNYAASQNGTITFCPSTPGDRVRITFTAFDTESGFDYLDVWNANAVGAPGTADDRFMGTPALPFTVTSTSPDGCLSFQFISDGSIQYAGWSGTISCVTPCVPPTAALVDTSTVDICPSTSVTPGSSTVAFNASNSTTPGGSLVRYEWDWGDGTSSVTAVPNTTHAFPTTGGLYVVRLRVRNNIFTTDPLGCLSTNSVTRTVRVMPSPSFTGTSTSPVTAACGSSVTLNGSALSQTIIQSTPTVISSPVNLPDGSGANYTSSLDFSGLFPAGATITAGCYPTLSFNLEHSYSGDLEITLISPSGQSVMVYDQHGGGTHFGTCANAADDGVPGCVANYTIVNTGGIAWTAATGVTTTTTTNCGVYTGACETGNYYIPQIYNSTNSFNALNGATMNGVWTLQIRDNLAIDDGVLTNWSLTFPSSCYSNLQTITPDLSTATWTHIGGGPSVPAQTTTTTIVNNPGPACPSPGPCIGNQLNNNITIGPFPAPGSYVYSFTVTDEFGCQYKRDITVNALCPCLLSLTSQVNSDNQAICLGNTIAPIAYTFGGSATSVNVTGLPNGLFANIVGSVVTISGTPTLTGTYNYTVSSVGCTTNFVLNGTITISPGPSLNTITNNSSLCGSANAIFNLTGTANAIVTYNINGGAAQTVTLNAGGTGTVTVTGVTTNTILNTTSIVPTAVPIIGNGLSATGGNTPVNSTGIISALGATANVANCSFVDNTNSTLTITLQHTVPAGTSIIVSLARDTNAGTVTITSGGASITFNVSPNDILQRITIIPTVATNTVTITRTAGIVWVDGVQYTFTSPGCSIPIFNSSTVFVNTIPSVPTIASVAPTCSSDGTSSISNYSATNTYTFTPTGPTVGASGVITGMVLGTSYTVTSGNGICTSASSVGFSNAAQLLTPSVPTIASVAPTCSSDGT
uniref:proprotein convertase P-domain-containing protein n=1 Tax=uncultured Flavobacterium sp. TaxID=165435 RepID=UPI00259875FC